MSKNIYYSSIDELSEQIRNGEVSSVEITRECLKRIEKLNSELNAFITVLGADALHQAEAADAEIKAGKWRGRLHGIPVAVKDFYDTAGIKTTAAFKQFRDRVPTKDAVAVTKLKDAGAVIVGKTNMHTLGMGTTGLESDFGPVHNPWNGDYIPGGSSSGSAAAVASGMCYATLDTDAVGSVRLPAACCHVVGFKGSYDLISTKGILDDGQPADPFIMWMGHAGVTTRTVEDTALVLNVLSEQKGDYSAGLKKIDQSVRIGVGNNFKADAEVSSVFKAAVETIRGLGYKTTSAVIPFGDPFLGDMQNIETDRKAIAGQAFKDVDIFILPSTETTVPTVANAGNNNQALSAEMTAFANYYGLPALSVPCGFDSNGLPLGVQLVGKPGGERTLLNVAYHYQTATKKKNSRYPVA